MSCVSTLSLSSNLWNDSWTACSWPRMSCCLMSAKRRSSGSNRCPDREPNASAIVPSFFCAVAAVAADRVWRAMIRYAELSKPIRLVTVGNISRVVAGTELRPLYHDLQRPGRRLYIIVTCCGGSLAGVKYWRTSTFLFRNISEQKQTV